MVDCYGIKSEKQFINTLEDNIHESGAMDKLISDHVQVEVGKKVKDISIVDDYSDFAKNPENNVYIKNGFSFGDGDHKTSILLIELLADLIDRKEVLLTAPVWDLGCGSGIISIFANKLGFSSLFATDICPVALSECRANAVSNNMDFYVGENLPCTVDRIPAILINILPPLLFEVLPDAWSRLSSGGVMLLSGLNRSQVFNWEEWCPGAKQLTRFESGGWYSIALCKPHPASLSSQH